MKDKGFYVGFKPYPEIQSHIDYDVQTTLFLGKKQLLLLCISFPFHQPKLIYIGNIISCSAFWIMLFLRDLALLALLAG